MSSQRYSTKYSVGLTGGIGSGKSTVADFFQKFNVDVIDADKASHLVTRKNATGTLAIAENFGYEFISDDGELNRALLREYIFNSPLEKKRLENMLHPLIREEMAKQASLSKSPYLVFDVPLLIETQQFDRYDEIIGIITPLERRIEWIKNRNQFSKSHIMKIINSQANDEERLTHCHHIIHNDSSLITLENRINAIHQHFLNRLK